MNGDEIFLAGTTASGTAVSVVRKLASIKNSLTEPIQNTNGVWWVLAILILVTCVLVAIYIMTRNTNSRKRIWAGFSAHAENIGLCSQELDLLTNIAGKSSLKNPNIIFTDEPTFNRGMSSLSDGGFLNGVFGANKPGICGSCVFLTSLRQKLGFQLPADQTKPPTIDLGPIAQSAVLTVERNGQPESFTVSVDINDPLTKQLIVIPPANVSYSAGESWLMRYPQQGILWEFNAIVIARRANRAVLKPVGDVRWINRRRFKRVPTHKPAHIAQFPFRSSINYESFPTFSPGVLIEMGGPGAQIDTSLKAKTGDRMLVVMQIDDHKVVESQGIVRRVRPDGNDGTVIALELIGLTTNEVSELARETNAFAHV